MKVHELFEESTITIKGNPEVQKAKDFIKRVYDKYPKWPMDARQRCIVWGEGDDQEFVNFELEPSFTKRGAVEVKWFASYPHRKGVGLRGMKVLQDEARKDGISLTLFPWDRGRLSQAALMKFYKKGGFQAIAKGSKNMHWSPEETK